MNYDVLITNGVYPDFEAGCLTPADIAIADGKIAAILAPGSGASAAETIDAKGHVVSPGFIDMHMHEEDFKQAELRFDVANYMVKMGVTTALGGNCGSADHHYADFKKIVSDLGGSPVNYILLAGYNSLREEAGFGWYDSVPAEKRLEIQQVLRQQIADGAWGVSFGLEYAPGISTDEMTEAVQAIRESDPFVSIHFRADCEECMASLQEMAQLSRDTNCRVQVSHLSSLAGTGHNMPASLDYLAQEIAANPKFGYDTYPYTAFSTGIGTAAFDMDWCAKWGVDYDIILLLHEPYRGQRCDKALYEKVRRETPDVNVVAFAMDAESIRQAIAHPAGLFGSDGGITHGTQGHPRVGGTFPRILGKYVREEQALTLMEALDKMTRRAAARIGIDSKGQIAVGYDADITVFDPETIMDGPDFTDLSIPNTGIDCVLIGGHVAVKDNVLSEQHYGKIIDRK